MDLEIIFRILFVVGIVTIPILYWFLGRGLASRDPNKAQSKNERGEREHRSEEPSLSREDDS